MDRNDINKVENYSNAVVSKANNMLSKSAELVFMVHDLDLTLGKLRYTESTPTEEIKTLKHNLKYTVENINVQLEKIEKEQSLSTIEEILKNTKF